MQGVEARRAGKAADDGGWVVICKPTPDTREWTIRDELAAQVFVAMIPHHIPYTVTSGERVVERGGEPRLASMSYALADAFLAERTRQREAGGK